MPTIARKSNIPRRPLAHSADKFPGPLLAEGVNTSNSSRNNFACTASATPHTVGSWVEVDASLSATADGVFVGLAISSFTATTNTSTLIDIGTGAGGSETVWATINIGYRSVINGVPEASCVYVPGRIAAGTRVAVRARSAVASKTITAYYMFLSASSRSEPFTGPPVTMGAVTGSSRGTTITAPGALDTKGAWTQIVASTSQAFSALLVSPSGNGGTAMSSTGILVDIGIGGSGAETVIIPDIYCQGDSSEYYQVRSPNTSGLDIPAGSRLSARYSRDATGNALDLILVGA